MQKYWSFYWSLLIIFCLLSLHISKLSLLWTIWKVIKINMKYFRMREEQKKKTKNKKQIWIYQFFFSYSFITLKSFFFSKMMNWWQFCMKFSQNTKLWQNQAVFFFLVIKILQLFFDHINHNDLISSYYHFSSN